MRVLLLAAGVGKRFGPRTRRLPKCLIPLGKSGPNLLGRYFGTFRSLGLKDIVIVVGHQKEKIRRECAEKGKGLNIRFAFNRRFREGSVLSLYKASAYLKGSCLVMDADVYFPTAALKRLLASRHPTAFLVDRRSRSTGEEMMLAAKNGRPVLISKKTDPRLKIIGEATGLFKIGAKDAPILRKILADFVQSGRTNVEYEETYNALMAKRKVGFVPIRRLFWTEMDFEEDLKKIVARQTLNT